MNRHPLHIALVMVLCAQFAAPTQAGLFSRRKKEPTVVYQPVVVGCCGGCATRPVVNYRPATVYTTTWVRVPVTTYRQVATTDPTTCCRVNYMQPTTSYVWQARRKPHVIYRPFVTHVASCVANACGCTGGSCPGSSPAFVTTAPAAGQGPLVMAPGPAPAASPYPPSPYSGAAPTTAPIQSPTVLPGTAAPTTIPGMAPGIGTGVPADQPPRLDPRSVVPPTTSTQRPAVTWPQMMSPSATSPLTTSPYPASPYTSSPLTPNPASPYTSQPMSPISPSRPLSPSPTPAPTPAAPIQSQKPAAPQAADPSVQPVPDPDAPANGNGNGATAPAWNPPFRTPSVPRLLNPSDRTASLRPKVVVPVSWPVRHAAPRRDIRQPQAPAAAPRPHGLDDTGWAPAY